jgi:hypothetical protein
MDLAPLAFFAEHREMLDGNHRSTSELRVHIKSAFPIRSFDQRSSRTLSEPVTALYKWATGLTDQRAVPSITKTADCQLDPLQLVPISPNLDTEQMKPEMAPLPPFWSAFLSAPSDETA